MANPNETTSERSLNERLETNIDNGGFARKRVLRELATIRKGEIQIHENGESMLLGATSKEFPLRAVLHVKDSSLYRDIAMNGSIGAAESYMEGKWTTTDLTDLVRIFTANPEVLQSVDNGMVRLMMPLFRLGHRLRRNSRSQSRKNIHAHYDLGNDLFKLFLDPTLSYSSAIYPNPESTLDEAAVHKIDLVCRKLQLKPEDHLLEIGTGWGALAIHACKEYGCRVTTTTISDGQYQLAKERIEKANLADRITLLKKDYRELDGQYDKLVSIEMIEAVGHEYLDTYLGICSDRLKPDGRALIQAILMTERNYDNYRQSVDFIQKYIFPGGALPSLSSIMGGIQKNTNLQMSGFQDISADYAHTLRDWRFRFNEQVEQVRALGYPEEFVRMWEFYFCYCEGGFTERAISTAQLVFDKPDCRLVHTY